jgi:hypothetical protein
MIEPEWRALIAFCQKHPYCTITTLEIKEGKPVIGIFPVQLSRTSIVFVKEKFDSLVEKPLQKDTEKIK